MEKASPLREGEKNCSGSSAIISYQPIQTTSPTAWSVRVCVYGGIAESERERGIAREAETQRATHTERERAGKGEAPYSFTYPPHQTTGRRGQTLSCQSNPLVAAGIISATNY